MTTTRTKTDRATTMKRSAGWREITPEFAQRLLDASKRPNRPISPITVRRYAHAMRNGKWNKDVSQAISIDWNGDIVNGHHRLLACVEAGVPFKTLYTTGVDPEAFADEDTGVGRNAGHFFAVMGEKHFNYLSGAARAIYLWDTGNWRAVAAGSPKDMFIRPEDLLETVKRRPSLRKAAQYMDGARGTFVRHMPRVFLAALYALTHGHPRHTTFWQELLQGVGVPADGPVHKLHMRLANIRPGHRIRRSVLLALVTKVWNAYAEDKAVGHIAFFGGKHETFPQPITRLTPALLPPEPEAEDKQ